MEKAMAQPTVETEQKGYIFNIQQFSVHDGPGIRTTVFLKGCPLRCFWCCNPESQNPAPDILRKNGRCLGRSRCGACLGVCGGALRAVEDDVHYIRERCTACGACAAVCPTEAMSVAGRWVTVSEVLRQVSQDALFYSCSGGGVTLSGGEALLQPEFSVALLRQAQRLGLSTALETCAHVPYKNLRNAAENLDYLLADIKTMDAGAHTLATGAGNERILDNLSRLGREFSSLPMTIRMPVIPGFNDNAASVREVARFVGGLAGNARLELLPYHRLGEAKYENLGLPYAFSDRASPGQEQMNALKQEAISFTDII